MEILKPKQKPELDEIATVGKDIYQDYIGKTLLNPDKVLKSESGGKGIELYEDLLRDPQVASNLQTRKLAVIGKEWEVIPVSEDSQDVKIADYVTEVFKNFNFDSARQSLLSGLVMGFKVCEIMWDYSEGDVFVKEMIPKASRRFTFDLDKKLRLLTLSSMIDGEELPDKKFQVFTNPSDNGSPFGDGLGRMLYWPVWFKKNVIKFWVIFADKFGSPTTIGKYPPGTSKPQQDELLEAIETIQQESAVKIPNTMIIELLEAARAGSVNTYESFCNFMNAEISKILLGQTLTTEVGDTGSYAASQTHNEVRLEIVKADADLLCEQQNEQMVKWIVDYNFPIQNSKFKIQNRQYPKAWIRTEPEKDTKTLADRDVILARDMRLPITKKYCYETYNIPEPEEGEEILELISSIGQAVWGAGQDGKRALSGVEGQQFAENAPVIFTPAQQAIEGLKEDAIKNWDSLMDPVLGPIKKIIAESATLEEVKARIMDAYGVMDDSKMAELLARVMFGADAWGRVTNENGK